jgi:hypothetical protein
LGGALVEQDAADLASPSPSRRPACTTDKAPNLKRLFSAVARGTEKVIEAVGGESATLKALGGHPETHPLGETYFTQVPILYGPYMAKLQVAPVAPALTALKDAPVDLKDRPDGLREEVVSFFAAQGGEWDMRVQLNTDLDKMPIEDASVEWPEDLSPYVTVARLRVAAAGLWRGARAPDRPRHAVQSLACAGGAPSARIDHARAPRCVRDVEALPRRAEWRGDCRTQGYRRAQGRMNERSRIMNKVLIAAAAVVAAALAAGPVLAQSHSTGNMANPPQGSSDNKAGTAATPGNAASASQKDAEANKPNGKWHPPVRKTTDDKGHVRNDIGSAPGGQYDQGSDAGGPVRKPGQSDREAGAGRVAGEEVRERGGGRQKESNLQENV